MAALSVFPQSASAWINNRSALEVLYELGDDWEDAAIAYQLGCDAGRYQYSSGSDCHVDWDSGAGNFTSWDLRSVMSFVLWRVHGAGGSPSNNHSTMNVWNSSLFASYQNVTESQFRDMCGRTGAHTLLPTGGLPPDAPLPPSYFPPDEEFVSRAPPRPEGCDYLSGDNREVTASGQQWYWLDHTNRCVRWFDGEQLTGPVVQVAEGEDPPVSTPYRAPDYSNQFDSANPPACADSTVTNYDPRYFTVTASDKDGDGFVETRVLNRILGTTCSSPNDVVSLSTTQQGTTAEERAPQATASGESRKRTTTTTAATQHVAPSGPPAVCVVVATPHRLGGDGRWLDRAGIHAVLLGSAHPGSCTVAPRSRRATVRAGGGASQ